MPICAVVGCGNSDFHLNQWQSKECDRHPGVKHSMGICNCDPPFRLFAFPTERKNPEVRTKWIQVLKRDDPTTGQPWFPKRFSRVCSRHFIDGQPTKENPYPTLHMGYQSITLKAPRKPPVDRSQSTSSSNESPQQAVQEHVDLDANVDCITTEGGALSLSVPLIETEITESESTEITYISDTHTYDHTYSRPIGQRKCTNCLKLESELQVSQCKIATLQCHKRSSHATQKTPFDINTFVKSDQSVVTNTGLPNKAAFKALYRHLLPLGKKMRYWKGKKNTCTSAKRKFKHTPQKSSASQRKLCAKYELILVLLKLRLGLKDRFLCDLFGISLGLCSQIFNTWIKLMASELKPLILWPDRITVTKMMPPGIGSKYPKLRCTLDCTEIFIQRPRHLELQALTWSDYKKSNTAKYLVGIAPNGSISFLSSGWCGRTSDKHIVNHSGFLDLVDPGDVILADRGFTINAELLMRQARLEIPPPSSGWEQQESAAVKKTKKVANARIHVERAIGRLKWFEILCSKVPISLIPLLDDIVVVCAAICNLHPSLVK